MSAGGCDNVTTVLLRAEIKMRNGFPHTDYHRHHRVQHWRHSAVELAKKVRESQSVSEDLCLQVSQFKVGSPCINAHLAYSEYSVS